MVHYLDHSSVRDVLVKGLVTRHDDTCTVFVRSSLHSKRMFSKFYGFPLPSLMDPLF